MKIIECPRDAMQGLHDFVPTGVKIEYLNSLLKVGFDTLDFGSFVSPKAIPQMRDTSEVLKGLTDDTYTKLLAIVANERGANDACQFDRIRYLGFPLSVSESFQQRNTNKSIEAALVEVAAIHQLCQLTGKQLVVYLSMGFGNPYGDPYSVKVIHEFVAKLDQLGIEIVSLADTIGSADIQLIKQLFTFLIHAYPHIEIGAHLHATPDQSFTKIQAIIETGCTRIDGALLGFGGCPMAKDELTGNLDTLNILSFQDKVNLEDIDLVALEKAKLLASKIFSTYH